MLDTKTFTIQSTSPVHQSSPLFQSMVTQHRAYRVVSHTIYGKVVKWLLLHGVQYLPDKQAEVFSVISVFGSIFTRCEKNKSLTLPLIYRRTQDAH